MKFSFLMICYNQEKYIAEALNSALAQDYEELEIIVSDDNSTDKTFEIASEIAKNYNGPFKIILNKNESNLGIGANFYKAYTLSTGDWLFMAAGDDISYSNRCKIAEQAIIDNPNSFALGSYREIIDGKSCFVGYDLWNDYLHGAAAVWNRDLFEKFNPISKSVMSEDHILAFRTLILDKSITEILTPTIKYRLDCGSVSNATCKNFIEAKEHYLKKQKYYQNILFCLLNDIEKNKNTFDKLKNYLINKIAKSKKNVQTLENELEFLKINILFKIHAIFFGKKLDFAKKIKLLFMMIFIKIIKVKNNNYTKEKCFKKNEYESYDMIEYLHNKKHHVL